MRCIKRGLQDQCHDGVRKKAKYLHDAPAEALVPGFAGNYHVNGGHGMHTVPGAPQMGSHGLPVTQPNSFYPHYNQMAHQGPLPPQMMQHPSIEYAAQPNVDPASQFPTNSSQQMSPVSTMTTTMDQNSMLGNTSGTSFDPSFVDPNDPSLFNFNVSDLNFGNHYGALEFGMLGHMATGAMNSPDTDGMGSMGPSNQGSVSYEGSLPQFGYSQSYQPWQSIPNFNTRQHSTHHLWTLTNNAFAVGENTASGTGASDSQGQDFSTAYSSTTVSPEMPFAEPDTQAHNQHDFSEPQPHSVKRKRVPFPNDVHESESKKKPRQDTKEIYAGVKEPYPYTQGFHALIDYVKKYFPSSKVLRIAKALASIRPSFIACNKGLNYDDLIFMEKSFQRTLFEYNEFMNYYGTPTIILRRTGEIAQVSKEFCLITGWRQNVILGKEPNLNVNTGISGSKTQSGTNSKGTITPRIPTTDIQPGRPRPVMLPEILDEDSVVQFYEDFAELAFGASRSSIIGANVSLVKYKTKDDRGWGVEDGTTEDGKPIKKQSEVKSEALMKGEAGMNALGEADGRVNCIMAWTVKRDTFDIPMMIVMNVS